ncbi:MAG: ISL3 family transposase [Actinobacteria bacterium]|nr:ISL3 family transposase [Actinomycetota bacterium]MCA1700946.1 ISL3 family transposase [Actinomycetota bacterium]
MRPTRVWKRLLGLRRVVVEEVCFEEGGEGRAALVISLRPKARERDRCGICRRRCPGYDWGEGRRRWRSLDLGTTFCLLEAWAPRVECRRHGVVVCAVPWARHDSKFTRAFEDQVCWLAVNTSKTAVSELMRIAWRTVGWICERAMAEQGAKRDLLAGLRRIGFDEISVRKGQRYLTVVVDHDTGRLVWAHPGRDKATVEKFLDLLGAERCQRIELVSCDMADWITGPIAERCPHAAVCLDPFHLIKLATDALDEIRREVWNEARRQGHTQLARELKGARFALWKNAERLTERQQLKLARIQQINKRLYRAYLLAQQLRQIYRVPYEDAIVLLEGWLQWARRCRLAPFVKVAKTITARREGIEAAIRHGLSNARVEQVNTQIRLITRRGFGFHSPHAVIALAMLSLGGLCPPLPGR